MMKRFALLCIFVLTATLAWAGTGYLGTTTSASSTVGVAEPTASTDGYAIQYAQSVKGFSVTVADQRDGSVGDALDAILKVQAFAWCYNTRTALWTRLPALDVALEITDGGTGAGTAGLPASQTGIAYLTQPGLECSRIAYSTGVLNLPWDGGTGGFTSYPVHKVSVSEIH